MSYANREAEDDSFKIFLKKSFDFVKYQICV